MTRVTYSRALAELVNYQPGTILALRETRSHRTHAVYARVAVRSVSPPPWQDGLNKGEARNALSAAVLFYRLGELRDRSFEGRAATPEEWFETTWVFDVPAEVN